MRKIGLLLVAALLMQAAPANGEQATLNQERYLIYPTLLPTEGARELTEEKRIDFEVVKTHAGWKKFFADLGLIYPFFQVKLSVANGDDNAAPVKEARWEFPTEYYFPEDAGDIVGTEVLVNVWRSFPVTAHVRFADGSEKKYRKWIEPEEFPRN